MLTHARACTSGVPANHASFRSVQAALPCWAALSWCTFMELRHIAMAYGAVHKLEPSCLKGRLVEQNEQAWVCSCCSQQSITPSPSAARPSQAQRWCGLLGNRFLWFVGHAGGLAASRTRPGVGPGAKLHGLPTGAPAYLLRANMHAGDPHPASISCAWA